MLRQISTWVSWNKYCVLPQDSCWENVTGEDEVCNCLQMTFADDSVSSVILFIPVLDWARTVGNSEWWRLIWRKSDSRSSSQLHLEKCLTPIYTPPLSWPVQGEGMLRDLAYIHPLSSSITCAVAEVVSFMMFLFFLVPALCSLLTPLISYSLFCFLIFKHINEFMHMHTHAHLSVSLTLLFCFRHSHSVYHFPLCSVSSCCSVNF